MPVVALRELRPVDPAAGIVDQQAQRARPPRSRSNTRRTSASSDSVGDEERGPPLGRHLLVDHDGPHGPVTVDDHDVSAAVPQPPGDHLTEARRPAGDDGALDLHDSIRQASDRAASPSRAAPARIRAPIGMARSSTSKPPVWMSFTGSPGVCTPRRMNPAGA